MENGVVAILIALCEHGSCNQKHHCEGEWFELPRTEHKACPIGELALFYASRGFVKQGRTVGNLQLSPKTLLGALAPGTGRNAFSSKPMLKLRQIHPAPLEPDALGLQEKTLFQSCFSSQRDSATRS